MEIYEDIVTLEVDLFFAGEINCQPDMSQAILEHIQDLSARLDNELNEVVRLTGEVDAYEANNATLRARLAAAVELLEVATCPSAECDGEGYPVQSTRTVAGYGPPDENGEPTPAPVQAEYFEMEQCQWHDEQKALIAKLKRGER